MAQYERFFEKMTFEERMKWLKSQIVDTDDILEVCRLCETLWTISGLMVEGDAGFVFGDTRAGKSFAVSAFADAKFEQLKELRPNSQWKRLDVPGTPIRPILEKVPGEGEKRPLVVVLVNPKPTYKSLVTDTALALNIALPSRWTGGIAMKLIMDQLVEQNVKMVVFDEIQHIVEGGSDSYSAADVFKIMAKARVQIVGIGLESYKTVMFEHIQAKNEPDPRHNTQLKALKNNQVTIRPLSCTLADFPQIGRDGKPIGSIGYPMTPYRRFCEDLDDRSDRETIVLPFDQSSELSNPQTALRLWRAFEGSVGHMMKFLIAATALAITEGQRRLTPRLLAEVYRRRAECNDDDNWFLMDWPEFTARFDEKLGKSASGDQAAAEKKAKSENIRTRGPRRRPGSPLRKH